MFPPPALSTMCPDQGLAALRGGSGGTAPNTVCVCEYVRGDRMPRRKYRRGWRRHGGARAGRGGGCARLATQDAAGQLAWIRELVAEHPPGTRAIGTMAWPPSPELKRRVRISDWL